MQLKQGAQVSALTDPIGFHDDLFSLQTRTKLENSVSHAKRGGPFESMEITFFACLLRLSSTHPTAKGGKQYKLRHYFRPRQMMGEKVSLARQRQLFCERLAGLQALMEAVS